MPEKKRRLQVWLPATLLNELEELAETGDRNLTQEAARAIRDYVKREQKRRKEENGG